MGTPLGEGVGDGSAVIGQSPLEDPGGFEVAEPVGQQVRRDAGEPVAQLAEARRPHQELADDQQIPPVAHHIQGPGEPAVLTVISTHRHLLANLKLALL